MKSLLILPHIKVENANAISGLVYGFPAVTHFLGYVHALSRQLASKPGIKQRVKLGGCRVISITLNSCAQNRQGWESVFALTRNPLTKDADTAPFMEEGRVHMEVSLVIECNFTSDDFDFDTNESGEDTRKFKELIHRLAITKRLAGGTITEMKPARFHEIPVIEEDATKTISQN